MEQNQPKPQQSAELKIRCLNIADKSKKHLENDFADKYLVIKAANAVRAKFGAAPMTEEEIRKYVY